ncbi:MAG: hypothetical protein JWP06_631 [Candidatus Saccharibacteria bacterium]|nr:hypothetical protein [Candidatus Saccharibacteria bacterium]
MDSESINLEDLHVQNGNYEKFTKLIMKMAEDPDMADILLRMMECAKETREEAHLLSR